MSKTERKNNMLQQISFIKPNVSYDKHNRSYSPQFRKTFTWEGEIKSARLAVCGLGIGYFYLNGKPVSEDLFTAPASDYTKTIWYHMYDVTNQIIQGENLLACQCGNGWYNEDIPTDWAHHEAKWRDIPKMILALEINGKQMVVSDESWKCNLDASILYNQLREGEHFDSRLYQEHWNQLGFDDSSWEFAKIDETPPVGVLRECLCEPIRECEILPPVQIIPAGKDRYVFDFGKNMSGYVKLKVNQPSGDVIQLEYAESLTQDMEVNYENMLRCFHEGNFQTCKFICNGKETEWKPQFSYFGFRYVIVSGLKQANKDTLTAYFVHQDIEMRSDFECSDPQLNQLFKIGQRATWSNLFYMPTDCPTREKLGWLNDAQGTAEQFLTNFKTEHMYEKWMQDLFDAMKEETGELPGIVPTPGWGYHWGNGLVSEGALFEIPYRVYLHTGNLTILKAAFPHFQKFLAGLKKRMNKNGDMDFGLDDWASPFREDKVNRIFINRVLHIKCLKIAIKTAKVLEKDCSEWEKERKSLEEILKEQYLDENGTCIINKQTAVAMLIYHELYDDLEPLKEQLKFLVESRLFHHNCGMVGIRHLYMALNKCGLEDYAYRIITAKGFPSYSYWLEDGATTLYERWNKEESKNHHMYSDFMSWMMKTIVGIRQTSDSVGFQKTEIKPFFFKELSYARGYSDTVSGTVKVEWQRINHQIHLKIWIPETMSATFEGNLLQTGLNEFIC